MKNGRMSILFMLMFALGASVALADVTWNGQGDGVSLNDGANWSSEAVPGDADAVYFSSLSEPLRVTANGDLTWDYLHFNNTQPLEMDLDGHTLTVDATQMGTRGVVEFSADTTLNNGTLTASGAASLLLGTDKTVLVTNSTASFKGLNFGYVGGKIHAIRNKLLICDTALSVSDVLTHGEALVFAKDYAISNLVEMSGTSGTPHVEKVTMSGDYNTFRMTRGKVDNGTWSSNASTIGGSHNCLELLGGYTKDWIVGGHFNTMVISDATVGYIKLDGKSNTVQVASNAATGSTSASAGKNITLNGAFNVVQLVANAGSEGVVLKGVTNTVYVASNAVTGTITLDGVDNVLELEGMNAAGKISGIKLGGTNNTFRIKDAGVMAPLPTFFGHTERRTFEISGMAWTNTTINFSGRDTTYLVHNGGSLTLPSSAGANAFNFSRYSTNVILRIAQDGKVNLNKTVNATASMRDDASLKKNLRYDWTNCPNCAIEFAGKNPLLKVASDYSYAIIALGTPDEEPLIDPVRLRFIVPLDNYAAAPIQQTRFNGKDFFLWGNQPIDVKLADGSKYSRKTMDVKLIYDYSNFARTPMNEDRLAKLNANARLPLDAYLYYKDKTLYCHIPARGGTMIIVK